MQNLRVVEQDFSGIVSIDDLTDDQKLFLQIQSQLILEEDEYTDFENIDPTLIEMLIEEMDGSYKLKFVEDNDSEASVVGVATLKRYDSITKIETLIIDKAARNRKLGEQALNLITSLVSNSCETISLNPTSEAAARFYDRNDFVFDYTDTSSRLGTMVKPI